MLVHLDEEIDGNLLLKLPFEEICLLVPKIKDRIKFIEQLDKLKKISNDFLESISNENQDHSNDHDRTIDSSDKSNTNIIDTDISLDEPLAFDNNVSLTSESVTSNDNAQTNSDARETYTNPTQNHLPSDYELTSLSNQIKILGDEIHASKLKAHTTHRRMILDAVFRDVSNNYQIL